MNVNEMTFGCELEVYLPDGTIPCQGGYHCGRQVNGLPAGWQSQSDSSLCDAPSGYKAVEIVSPILRGPAGLQQVAEVCAWLNSKHARVTKKCGFHVHVGVNHSDDLLRKIACLTAKHEKALFAVTGSRDRETGNYCRTVANNQDYQNAILSGRQLERYGDAAGRYHVLNLSNILTGGRPTVEFRVFGGTTNTKKAQSYIRMALAIVEKAHNVKRLPKWTVAAPKETGHFHRGGSFGQGEVVRFLYYMGWTKGRSAKVYGNIQGEGIATLKEAKKEMMRLAAKYDAR